MKTYTQYQYLIKPQWAPPAWLFGPVWSVLYILIAASYGYVGYLYFNQTISFMVVLPFLLNLFFNLIFTPIQFGLKSNILAAIDILLVLCTLVWALAVMYPYASWVSFINIPYLLWVTFATGLQLTITFLNRKNRLICCMLEQQSNKKIVLIGGSGFIGTKLTEALLEKRYSVFVIDIANPRIDHQLLTFKKLDLTFQHLDPLCIDGCYGIINLAGATIGKRWSEAYKKLIYDSRIATTRTLVQAIAATKTKPKVLINASATGYYGDQKEYILTEDHPAGNDFLAKVCIEWEGEAMKAKKHDVRVVVIRTAHVLGPGGLLASLQPLFKKGLGGYFGSGEQYMPWIHCEDIVGIYLFALESKDVEGAYNVGAGQTLSQKQLFKQFTSAIHAPLVWPIPRFVARLLLGEFAEALMASQNTSSKKILNAGYVYKFNILADALKQIY